MAEQLDLFAQSAPTAAASWPAVPAVCVGCSFFAGDVDFDMPTPAMRAVHYAAHVAAWTKALATLCGCQPIRMRRVRRAQGGALTKGAANA